MPDKSQTTPDAATLRALAALDLMADRWARGVNLTRCIASILEHDDRESRLEAFVRQAWVEGAWCGRRGLSPDEIEELAHARD